MYLCESLGLFTAKNAKDPKAYMVDETIFHKRIARILTDGIHLKLWLVLVL